MFFRLLQAVLSALLFSTAASYAAQKQLAIGGPTSQPIGHYGFCQRLPAECRSNAKDYRLVLTRGMLLQISGINRRVNESVRPRNDIDVYGRDEWWALPSDVGDCEDYALLKRQLLHQAGIPLSSLLIGVVRQKNGDGHAVLVVRTTRGNLVLDNLTDKIRPWDEVPYRWLKVQAPEHSGKWRTVNLVDLDPATASLSE